MREGESEGGNRNGGEGERRGDRGRTKQKKIVGKEGEEKEK